MLHAARMTDRGATDLCQSAEKLARVGNMRTLTTGTLGLPYDKNHCPLKGEPCSESC